MAAPADRQADWGRHLERQRLMMMKARGPWLPGPGAQAAAATADEFFGGGISGIGGGEDADEATGGISDKLAQAKEQYKQHGAIGAIMAFIPPQAQKGVEEATKAVLKQLLAWHWGFIGAVETIPVALLVTGPILNIWLYKKHIQGTPGLCKYDIMDLAALLLYDLLVLLATLLLVFLIAMIVMVVYVALNPGEGLGLLAEIGIL